MPFSQFVQQALTIAHRVQADLIKREASPPRPERDTKKAKKQRGNKQGRATKPDTPDADLPDAELLSKYSRCPQCAWQLQHPTEPHNCMPDKLRSRINGIKHSLRQGKDPNAGPSGARRTASA